MSDPRRLQGKSIEEVSASAFEAVDNSSPPQNGGRSVNSGSPVTNGDPVGDDQFIRDGEPGDHNRGATTVDAGRTFDDGKGRVFPCENCGGDLEFHIGQQSLKCPWCGHVKEIQQEAEAMLVEQDFHHMLMRIRELREARKKNHPEEADPGNKEDRKEIRCESCGGNVEFIGTLTSTHCPYCNAPVQLEKAHKSDEDRIPVDGVLPFQVDRNRAKQNLAQWVASRWFAPNNFRKQGAEGKFSGIYLSYFTFDSLTFNSYTGKRGEYYYVTVGTGKNRRQERRTRWYPASGAFQRFFDDVLVLANTGLRRDYMLALEPWPLNLVIPFKQEMLAGFLARTYDIELDQSFGDAKDRIVSAIHAEVRARIGGDTQQVDDVRSRYEAITFKHLLLPTWLMAYRYHGKTYQIFINAATGEVQGERPYSAWKIFFAVAAAVIGIGGLFALAQN